MAKLEMAVSLSDGLTSRFEKQQHCDITFDVDGKQIKAHKVVLGVRSEVLGDLTREWNDQMDPIPIDFLDFDSFRTLLR